MSGPTFRALSSGKQILSHVGIGMGAASFWRGAWYVLDDQLFPDDALKSAVSSLLLGTAGMAASQGLLHRATTLTTKQPPFLQPLARFGALYVVAMSCVLVWRGTWVGWDCVYEHYHNTHGGVEHTKKKKPPQKSDWEEASSTAAADTTNSTLAVDADFHASALDHGPVGFVIKSTDPGHLTKSGLASHGFAIVALTAAGVFASVLAPPAAVSVLRDATLQTGPQHARKAATQLWWTTMTTAKTTTTTTARGVAARSPQQQRALNYFYNHAQRRRPGAVVGQMDVSHHTNDRVLQFIPTLSDMSSVATSSSSLSMRRMTTSTQPYSQTGLFRSTTGTFTKGGARLP